MDSTDVCVDNTLHVLAMLDGDLGIAISLSLTFILLSLGSSIPSGFLNNAILLRQFLSRSDCLVYS